MNDLVSVGGICFVAAEPEKNANTRMNPDPHGPAQTEAESISHRWRCFVRAGRKP